FTASGAALSGTIAGVGTLAGTFSLATGLSATIPGSGVLSGTLVASVGFTATFAGVGTLSATFSLSTVLSATVPGVGTLAGTLTLKTVLSATIAGGGTVSATLSVSGIVLTATIAGVGTLSGTLTIPLVYNDYKVTIEPNLIAALAAKNLLNDVQVLGPDTTMASDASWVIPSSIDLSSTLSGYVRHAFPVNATDISNDSLEVAATALVD